MSAPKSQTPQSKDDPNAAFASLNYEQAYQMLEQIVATIESGQLSLEESLAAYQCGNQLLAHCQQSLADIEQQVKILNERQQLTPYDNDH